MRGSISPLIRREKVKILGAKVASGGNRSLILAGMIEKNGEKYRFRNYDGKPFSEIDYIPAGNNNGPSRGGACPGGGGDGPGGRINGF